MLHFNGCCDVCAGEICLVLEGADGAAHTPIQGPPGIDATQQADGDATLAGPAEHATPAAQAKIAQLEKAMPLLRQLIESGGSRPLNFGNGKRSCLLCIVAHSNT